MSAMASPEIRWENTAVTGQIQITKYAAEDNALTGVAAGGKLQGAVFEIVHQRSGVVVGNITTGTYSQRLNYRILYKTNYNEYRVLASNLLTTNNYAFAMNALPLMAGESGHTHIAQDGY